MSAPFPSMICNEPPPLDSEEEDSESFRDFPSAGLKLDILGEPSPQQSPIKSPLKKTVENGVNAAKVSSPEDTPFQSPMKKPIIENGLDVHIDNFQQSVQVPIQPSVEKSVSVIENGQEIAVDEALENPTVHVSDKNEIIENGFDIDGEKQCEQSHSEFTFNTENIDHKLELSPDDSPFESPFKAVFHKDVDFEEDTSEDILDIPVHNHSNEDLLENSLDNRESPSPLSPHQQQSPDQSPLSEDLFENCQDEFDFSKVCSAQSNDYSESNIVTPPADHQDLIKAQESCAQSELELADDDFGDFETFQSGIIAPTPTVDSTEGEDSAGNNNMKTSYIGTMGIEDDEFGNFEEATFAIAPIQTNSYFSPSVQEMPSQSQVEALNFNDNENFGDFEDFQSSSSLAFTDESKTTSPKVLGAMESKLEVLVKAVFNSKEEVKEDCAIVPLNKELNEEWRHVQDFEGSQGLQFKWSNCAAHQRMLHSLKIDTTAVMYTGKWGTIEVPRFAASIVESPLQPKVYNNAIDDELLSSTSPAQSTQDTASSRENVSKNQIQKSQSERRGQGSSEAQQILDQLPDLSFMRAKTLVFASQIQE